jgi:U3 small nucleolar ribonucleoprotein protein IMP4
MLRKNIRLRKEYLYSKAQEHEDRSKAIKKRKIKEAFENNSRIPSELRREEEGLRREIELEDENTAVPGNSIDNEYLGAGAKDPTVLITTSRKPSSRLMQFLKELKIVIPNATRINRGNYVIGELVEVANKYGFDDLIILHEHRGNPDGMIVSHLPSGPTAYFALSNVVLRHDLKTQLDTMPEEYPHLIFHNFNSRIGDRVVDILKFMFPVPKLESRRVLSFINKDDFIVFRHHSYQKEDYKTVSLEEIGPRFVLKLYQISLGTVDIEHAQTEWVLRPYMNTAKKRKVL